MLFRSYPKMEFGVSFSSRVQAALTARGSPAAAVIPYSDMGDETHATAVRLSRLDTPVIILFGSGTELIEILTEAKALGAKARFFLGGDLAGGLLAAAGPAAEGVIAEIEGFDPEGANQRTKVFVRAFREIGRAHV